MKDKLRRQIIDMLEGEQAHASLEQALEGIEPKMAGHTDPSYPYSVWQLLEHIRITQWDIVEFSMNKDHVSPKWPDEYWPSSQKPSSQKEIDNSIKQVKDDRQRMIDLLKDTSNDLLEPFSWGDGQNLLREAILIIDHNSYHTGQIILLLKLSGTWKG